MKQLHYNNRYLILNDVPMELISKNHSYVACFFRRKRITSLTNQINTDPQLIVLNLLSLCKYKGYFLDQAFPYTITTA